MTSRDGLASAQAMAAKKPAAPPPATTTRREFMRETLTDSMAIVSPAVRNESSPTDGKLCSRIPPHILSEIARHSALRAAYHRHERNTGAACLWRRVAADADLSAWAARGLEARRSFRRALGGRVRFVEMTYPRTLEWSLDDYAAGIEARWQSGGSPGAGCWANRSARKSYGGWWAGAAYKLRASSSRADSSGTRCAGGFAWLGVSVAAFHSACSHA